MDLAILGRLSGPAGPLENKNISGRLAGMSSHRPPAGRPEAGPGRPGPTFYFQHSCKRIRPAPGPASGRHEANLGLPRAGPGPARGLLFRSHEPRANLVFKEAAHGATHTLALTPTHAGRRDGGDARPARVSARRGAAFRRGARRRDQCRRERCALRLATALAAPTPARRALPSWRNPWRAGLASTARRRASLP